MANDIQPRTRSHWSRRSLLQRLALGAGGLSYAASARRELTAFAGAQAADLAQPKRLLVLWSPNGISPTGRWSDWLMPAAAGSDFTFGKITEPMAKHRSQLVFFDNLAFLTPVDYGDTHNQGSNIALTASHLAWPDGKTSRPTSPSIDFYIGEKVGRIATPQWPSVQIILQQKGYPAWVSYGMDGGHLPAFDSPWKLYSQLFGNLASGGDAKPDPSLATRLALRKSVLDAVAKDVVSFKRTLPVEDRMRADAQLDAIATMEGRLTAAARPTSGSCSRPTLGAAFDAFDTRRYPELLRATIDTVIASFACDVTRVMMLNMRGANSRPLCDFAPLNSSHYEHEMSHDFLDEFDTLKRWYMTEAVAYVADRLSAIPEGDGTMLDNTIVLWATEISTGHGHNRMPWMTIGGRNLGVDTGKLLRLPTVAQSDPKITWDGKPVGATRSRSEKGYPQSRLFVSFLHAFGIKEDVFGVPEFGTGPMDGYLKS